MCRFCVLLRGIKDVAPQNHRCLGRGSHQRYRCEPQRLMRSWMGEARQVQRADSLWAELSGAKGHPVKAKGENDECEIHNHRTIWACATMGVDGWVCVPLVDDPSLPALAGLSLDCRTLTLLS